MAETFQLDIVTPSRHLLSEKVEEVVLPGILGEFGVLANHTPFFTQLNTGELKVVKEEKDYYFAVAGGFVEVTGDYVIVLADFAEPADEIETKKVRALLEEAKNKLDQLGIEKVNENEYQELLKTIKKEETRLMVAEKAKE